jgi:hypothetical protein
MISMVQEKEGGSLGERKLSGNVWKGCPQISSLGSHRQKCPPNFQRQGTEPSPVLIQETHSPTKGTGKAWMKEGRSNILRYFGSLAGVGKFACKFGFLEPCPSSPGV